MLERVRATLPNTNYTPVLLAQLSLRNAKLPLSALDFSTMPQQLENAGFDELLQIQARLCGLACLHTHAIGSMRCQSSLPVRIPPSQVEYRRLPEEYWHKSAAVGTQMLEKLCCSLCGFRRIADSPLRTTPDVLHSK